MPSVFNSDAHLGFGGCRLGFVHEFARNVQCGQLSLVGDFIDSRSLGRPICRPDRRSEVVRAVPIMARQGARVICAPGSLRPQLSGIRRPAAIFRLVHSRGPEAQGQEHGPA
jgi:UDP-2,3-diacylglucosamine pyrophosphatase LpxH